MEGLVLNDLSRRKFLQHGLSSTSALVGGALILRADAAPTESSGDLGSYGQYLKPAAQGLESRTTTRAGKDHKDGDAKPLVKQWRPTEDNILGPFYREHAPFRAKVTPPLEAGVIVLVTGRVWGYDTRKPLSKAIIEVWQANAKGRYDNDDPSKPPANNVFLNRTRLVTDENGSYEFETIHPGAYQIGPNQWRPSHIHYMVHHPGYQTLVTQLYFEGDPRNKTDQFIKQSLIVAFEQKKVGNANIELGRFDIVLAPAWR